MSHTKKTATKSPIKQVPNSPNLSPNNDSLPVSGPSKNAHSNHGLHSDFCPKCGSLLNLDTLGSSITCPSCSSQIPFSEFVSPPIRTHTVITKEKDWTRKYMHSDITK